MSTCGLGLRIAGSRSTSAGQRFWIVLSNAASMLKALLVGIVRTSAERRWLTVAVAVLVASLAGIYAVAHFALNTDIDKYCVSTSLSESGTANTRRDRCANIGIS